MHETKPFNKLSGTFTKGARNKRGTNSIENVNVYTVLSISTIRSWNDKIETLLFNAELSQNLNNL